MVAKDSKPRVRSAKNKRANPTDEMTELPRSGSQCTTSDKIEEERGRLMIAETLLHCTVIAMEEGSLDEEAQVPHYPSVINQARELINYSVRELEALESESRVDGGAKHEVKEEAAEYLH